MQVLSAKQLAREAKISAWFPIAKGIITQVESDNRIEIAGGEKKPFINRIPRYYAFLLRDSLSGCALCIAKRVYFTNMYIRVWNNSIYSIIQLLFSLFLQVWWLMSINHASQTWTSQIDWGFQDRVSLWGIIYSTTTHFPLSTDMKADDSKQITRTQVNVLLTCIQILNLQQERLEERTWRRRWWWWRAV